MKKVLNCEGLINYKKDKDKIEDFINWIKISKIVNRNYYIENYIDIQGVVIKVLDYSIYVLIDQEGGIGFNTINFWNLFDEN